MENSELKNYSLPGVLQFIANKFHEFITLISSDIQI